jgi:HTH-type transcriptional regulator/antitoxin HigA
MSITKKTPAKDTYLALVKRFPLVSIKDERHYDEAVAFLKKLAIRDEGTLDTGEAAYLDALTFFVEDYENKHHRIEARQMTPLEALKYLLEESGMKPADLGRVLGNRSLATQILKAHRELSKANIVALANHFHVGPGLFLPVA